MQRMVGQTFKEEFLKNSNKFHGRDRLATVFEMVSIYEYQVSVRVLFTMNAFLIKINSRPPKVEQNTNFNKTDYVNVKGISRCTNPPPNSALAKTRPAYGLL